MGLLIAVGLVVLGTAGLLVWRSPEALLLAALLTAGAGAVWLAWAANEYRGLTSCPWDAPNRGHPWLLGLALSLGVGAIVAGTRQNKDSPGWAAILGLSAGVSTAVLIAVIATMFGAGLQCFD